MLTFDHCGHEVIENLWESESSSESDDDYQAPLEKKNYEKEKEEKNTVGSSYLQKKKTSGRVPQLTTGNATL